MYKSIVYFSSLRFRHNKNVIIDVKINDKIDIICPFYQPRPHLLAELAGISKPEITHNQRHEVSEFHQVRQPGLSVCMPVYSAGQKNVSTLLEGISQGFLEQI